MRNDHRIIQIDNIHIFEINQMIQKSKYTFILSATPPSGRL